MKKEIVDIKESWLYFLVGLAVLVNLSGLFVPLMDPDASIYATLSKNMVLRNNYWDLYLDGKDWLDKPHFPFWIGAFSFKLFGFHTWSYKFPAVCFVLMGAGYTYLFTKQYYNKRVALWAVFILLTTEHIIISNNDVRAEPFLTGLIIASIYHFSNTLTSKNFGHLVMACFFAACAVMTKGIFTLIPIAGAIGGQLIIKKEWKQVFHWRWLAAAVLICIFTGPELYSLWYQFDQHPEKIVFGKTNVSGIHFFLWDSQFGRFMNTGPIKGRGHLLFFVHTLIWAFLPWSLIMYASLIQKIRSGIKKINGQEWFSFCGAISTLLIFSVSQFQLPYYANIVFPMLSILTAQWIEKIYETRAQFFKIVQNIILVLLFAGGILLEYFYAPATPSFVIILFLALIVILLIILPYWVKTNSTLLVFYRVGLASLAFNFYLNTFFYPDLLKYQSSSEAAFYISEKYPGAPSVHFNSYAACFEFYAKNGLIRADTSDVKNPSAIIKSGIMYASDDDLDFFQKNGIRYEVVKEFPEFFVTKLSFNFVNKKTRDKELQKRYLVRLL